MFNLFRKKKPKHTYKFEWHDIGEGNPFNKRILDCRDYTLNNLATTADKSVADTFSRLRTSDGKEYLTQDFIDKVAIEVNLKYPPTGGELTDLIFKAQSFDEKWDIYIYNNCFYFTRSWTGELVYKAFATVDSNTVTVYRIELQGDETDKSFAVSNVHFLVSTQILKGILPHRVPTDLQTDMEIALYSFSQFGNKCWYATYDDILDTVIKVSGSNKSES